MFCTGTLLVSHHKRTTTVSLPVDEELFSLVMLWPHPERIPVSSVRFPPL